MSERPRDAGNSRQRPFPHIERSHQPDPLAMLAALRVVLGLPKRLPHFTPKDLLSSGIQSEGVSLTVENLIGQEETA